MVARCWGLGLIVASIATAAAAQTSDAWQSLQQQVAATIERASPAVVAIQRYAAPAAGDLGIVPLQATFSGVPTAAFETPLATGAGVVIDARGLVLTQYLNIRVGDGHRVITADGKTHEAVIKGADPRSGLAVLELADAQGLATLSLDEAAVPQKGMFVLAIGNPDAIALQGTASASLGMVTNIGQKAPLGTNFANVGDSTSGLPAGSLHQLGTLVETDARLGWTSGGGALVDLNGKLVAIITDAVTLPGSEAAAHYAIPVSGPLKDIIRRLMEGQEVEYALLGVSLAEPRTLLAPEAEPGATVLSAFTGTPAARAGLQAGDRITAVDGQPVASSHEVQLTVGLMPPGKVVQLELVRNSKPETAELKLSKYYVPGEKVVTAGQRQWRGLRVDYATAVPMSQLIESATAGLLDPQGCVVVSAVDPTSPAWQSDVRPGMFISHVGEKRVTTPDEFYAATAEATDSIDLRFTEAKPVEIAPQDAPLQLPLEGFEP